MFSRKTGIKIIQNQKHAYVWKANSIQEMHIKKQFTHNMLILQLVNDQMKEQWKQIFLLSLLAAALK